MGDGSCHDECNYADCGYDGGDCCKVDADKTYCTECQCKADTICQPVCLEMKGDGICDDYCNSLNCDYDGGDCCGDNVQCGPGSTVCQCLNEATTTTEAPTTTVGQEERCIGCNGIPGYKAVGDGYCDDGCNNPDCGYDGGDCCGPNVDKRYCLYCECKANGK